MTLHKQQKELATDCPIRYVFSSLTNRWTVLIILELTVGTLRFSEIKKRIQDISHVC